MKVAEEIEVHFNLSQRGFTRVKEIGKGGYSICFQVTTLKYEGINFVCKCIKKTDTSYIESFEDEIKALMRLDHPNIIKVYDYFDSENFFYIILEHCSNGTIFDLLSKNEKINPVLLEKYTRDIIDAIDYIHDQRVTHHDIKPENIFIDNYGRIKISDFGLSSINCSKNMLNSFKGTLYFLPPEVIKQKDYDPYAADIWSLGVTLYEMATCSLPFVSKEKYQLLSEQQMGPPSAKLPNYLSRIINSCLQYEPSFRSTAKQLKSMLNSLLLNRKLAHKHVLPKLCLGKNVSPLRPPLMAARIIVQQKRSSARIC